jgi:hypothetical protein
VLELFGSEAALVEISDDRGHTLDELELPLEALKAVREPAQRRLPWRSAISDDHVGARAQGARLVGSDLPSSASSLTRHRQSESAHIAPGFQRSRQRTRCHCLRFWLYQRDCSPIAVGLRNRRSQVRILSGALPFAAKSQQSREVSDAAASRRGRKGRDSTPGVKEPSRRPSRTGGERASA